MIYAFSLVIFLILLAASIIKPKLPLLPMVPSEVKEEARIFAASFEKEVETESQHREYSKGPKSEIEVLDLISEFDPNTASRETLLKAGISRHGVNSLLAYREAGGVFREAGDIEKIYGISKESCGKLYGRIRIDSSFRIPDSQNIEEIKPNEIREMIDINLAEFKDLISLPGVDGKLASRVLKYRELLGGFYDPVQLKEVYELPESLIVVFDSLFLFTCENLKEIPLNDGDYSALLRHPYLDRKEVDAMLELRKFSGEGMTKKQLEESGIFEISDMQRLLPYLPGK